MNRDTTELLAAISESLADLRATLEAPAFDPESTTEGEPVHVDPKPIAEPGDMIMVNGKWWQVKFVDPHPQALFPYWDGVAERSADEITDVYTEAEQEKNGALVQIDGHPPGEALEWLCEALPYTSPRVVDVRGRFAFLTPEATAALGEFQPVPDREIKVGDSVRFVSNYSGKEVVDRVSHINPSGTFGGFDADGRGWSRSEEDLSLVAPEDPAYREATERSESGQAAPSGRNGGNLARPDSNTPDTNQSKPGPAPSIPRSWDLITCGDGKHRARIPHPDQDGWGWRAPCSMIEVLTTDEVLALGPVRRCVPVTLPDHLSDDVSLDDTGRIEIAVRATNDLALAHKVAAEVLAAVLQAEEGEK